MQLTFVGGIDRADAELVGRAIGATPGYESIPVELGFHCAPRGIPDLLEGRISLAGFREALGERWWTDRLERITAAERLDGALERLTGAYDRDPVGACARLFVELTAPLAERAGKPGLVEHSHANLINAPTLERLFAEARFVHAVRDGRDVAARHAADGATAARLLAGVERWADDLRAIDSGVQIREEGAIYGVWPERLCVVVLGGAGGDSFAGLGSFLGLDEDPLAPSLLDPEPAQRPGGGWEHGLSARQRRRVRRRYERTLRALAEEGVHCAAALIEAREEAGG
ncbi:MAG TPA: hypothetical protein VEK39_03205 [Solirubrobacterales bacterium]|nr:hypothetical protein [Solirubrobacterales bacterium]